VADILDWALKDDRHSMEHPIFSLSKNRDLQVRHYEHNGNSITVKPGADGLATIWDKDVLIYLVSQLVEGLNQGREDAKSRKIRFRAYDYLVSTNRPIGGEHYKTPVLRAEIPRLPRLKCFEKAAAQGVPVYDVDDARADRAWHAYEAAGKENHQWQKVSRTSSMSISPTSGPSRPATGTMSATRNAGLGNLSASAAILPIGNIRRCSASTRMIALSRSCANAPLNLILANTSNGSSCRTSNHNYSIAALRHYGILTFQRCGVRVGRAIMNSTSIEPRRASWRQLIEGSLVWAPFGEHGWRPGIVTRLGKNRGDRTVVHLSFETGGSGQRYAADLWWRKPELKGKDRPKAQAVSA
jgi:Replication initiator protein A